MHFTTLLATATALAGLASAAPPLPPNCPEGNHICGYELYNIGWTQDEIFAVIRESGGVANQKNADGIFHCTSTTDSGLHWDYACKTNCNGRDFNSVPPNLDAFCPDGPAK